MTTIQWREHEGRRYLAVDYRGLSEDEALDRIREVAAIVEAEPEQVRMVSDFTGLVTSRTWVAESKKIARQVFDPRETLIALVGLSPFHQLALKGYRAVGGGRRMVPFDTVEDALAGLATLDRVRR